MSKEKLAIISSFDDFCGIASYTKALVEGLAAHYDVSVISLDVELLRKGEEAYVAKYINALCRKLTHFDCVNIQFEASIFGSSRSAIKKNLFTIAKASKRLVLTMHRIHGQERYPKIGLICKHLFEFKLKSLCINYKKIFDNNGWAQLFSEVVGFCMNQNVPIIVHSRKDLNFIKHKFSCDQVFDHPLCFYEQETIQTISKNYTRQEFCRDFCLDETHKYIGIFGFIHKMKGYATAIRALQHLPKNYELLIFGSQHSSSIKIDEEINDYINQLLLMINDMELSARIKFYRISNDDEFLKALLCCDFNVLPYLEVNQAGSGIGALTLETNSNAIFSQNFAFFELAKYAPNAFKMFSIGNHLELANAILTYRKSQFEPHLNAYHKQYNPSTNALFYKRLLSRTN